MKLPGLDVRWVKLLLLLIVLGVTGFMLANPALMDNEYFSALAGLPVGCCLVLAIGTHDPAVQARRQVLRQQRQIRERSMMTLAEWDKKYGTPVVTPVQK
jgi:tetrahydromethanopterin S-methyltransferase subunit H